PWEEAARGVVVLATPDAGKAATTKPARDAMLSKLIPMPDPKVVTALHARYAPLLSEKDAKDYEIVFGEEERAAAGKAEAMLALMGSLRDAAKTLNNQP